MPETEAESRRITKQTANRKIFLKMNYEIIIIGGGAAGISAALWGDDLKLNALLLEERDELGGQLLWTHNEIKNHLGTKAQNGRELRDIFVKQIADRKFDLLFDAKIAAIDFKSKSLRLNDGAEFTAENLIIATGIRRRKLEVEGEEKFAGKGIIDSGKRNADLVKDKKVCIVGGGDAAFENALILAETALDVTLVHRGENFRARAEFVEPAKKNPKIEIFTKTVVKKIFGDDRIEAVELENIKTKETFSIAADFVLRRIGVEPNTEFLDGAIELDANGYIRINHNCETNLNGIFAVGDVANPLAPTVSSAVGMGATAVKTITNFKLRITNFR